MKVILLEDVKNLGQSGQQVDVADGHARNFLIPKKLALTATPANQRVYENEAKARSKKKEKELAEAKALADKLSSVSVEIARATGEEDKLFGSVTNADIAEALEAKGHKVNKRDIVLETPLKALGDFQVEINVAGEIKASVKVSVVKQ